MGQSTWASAVCFPFSRLFMQFFLSFKTSSLRSQMDFFSLHFVSQKIVKQDHAFQLLEKSSSTPCPFLATAVLTRCIGRLCRTLVSATVTFHFFVRDLAAIHR